MKSLLTLGQGWLVGALALLSGLHATASEASVQTITKTPGLVAFWTFGEEAGQPRVSTGTKELHPLQEVGGPIARVTGGPFSGYSAELNGRQFFKIPYAQTGDLNISGPEAQVSMFAVVRIVNLKQSRTIAGMWSEGQGANDDTGTRQYALLMNMPTYGGPRQLVPHISSEGGVTRRADGSAFPWCADYAATKSEVPEEEWCTLGFTYDGKYLRAYLNGLLDARPLDPVKDKRTDRYFTSEGPDGKDRGMNPYFHGRGIFGYDPAKHALSKPGGGSDFTVGARYAVGQMLGEATIGRFGGLAVFNRALTDAEMKALHEAADVKALNAPRLINHPTNPPRADGYRGIWFTLGQFSKHGDKYSGGLGTYTANHLPMAVYSPQADKTFFTYGGTIKGQRHLLIMAAYFDHKTGVVPRPVIVHDKQGVADPHDNASLNIDDRGHIWIFVSGRGRARPGFKYRSREPFSIDAFERVSEEEMTYPQPWFVPGRGWLHLFTKYTRGRELYWETSTDGRAWSADHKLAGFGGHYQVSGQRGGRIASFFNFHPGGNVDKRTNLYYVQSDDFGATWTTADGRTIEVPLREVSNPALVIDFQSQGKLMYTCDLSFDSAGHPMLLYVASRGAEPGPENDPREFCLTRWDGRAWQTHAIARTDHNYDMGSLYVAGDQWTVIAPTSPGPQPFGGGGEMCLRTSSDQGRTWSASKPITHNSPRNHNYARRPLRARNPFFAFWADGDPGKLSESHLYFCDSTGERVWQLPYDMPDETARPVLVK